MLRQYLPLGLFAALLFAVPMTAQSKAHWANCPVTIEGDTITVEGRIAGLGNKQTADLLVAITATALCVDLSVPSIVATLPVVDNIGVSPRRGNVKFETSLTPVFDPACDAPLEVAFAAVTICEVTNPDIGCCLKGVEEEE